MTEAGQDSTHENDGTLLRVGIFTVIKKWWRWGDSNPRPSRCERDALPTELHPHTGALLPFHCLRLVLPHIFLFERHLSRDGGPSLLRRPLSFAYNLNLEKIVSYFNHFVYRKIPAGGKMPPPRVKQALARIPPLPTAGVLRMRTRRPRQDEASAA